MPAVQDSRPIHAVHPTSRPCSDCHGTLLLMSVGPTKGGSIGRLYQCAECARIEKVVTNKKWMGWLNSELRS